MRTFHRRHRRGGILVKLTILAVLVVGGYVGYRVVFLKEKPGEALQKLAESAVEKIHPIRQGDLSYSKGDFEKARETYMQALKRALSRDVKPEDKLSADELQHARRRVCDCLYELAEKSKWERHKVQEAIKAIEEFQAKYPTLPVQDRNPIKDRLTRLRSMLP